MRSLALLILLLLSGCTASRNAGDADSAIRAALAIIETGIDREDPILASQPVGERCFVATNIRTRYPGGTWGDGALGQAEFRKFFNGAFLNLSNVDQQFTLGEVTVNGQVATAQVQSRFDAVRIDSTPAENITFSGSDYMVFELEDSAWRMVRWDEAPAP